MTIFQPFDIVRTSVRETGALEPNRDVEVTKLIDVSKCIGCKACESACMEWNDMRPAVGENAGVYENPADLTTNMFTVMRFTEWDNPKTGNLEWLIRKDGCMHCEDPACLKACPSPGAIVQYANGIVDFLHGTIGRGSDRNCLGTGYCVKACPFSIPRLSQEKRLAYKCTLCSDKVAVGQEPACAKTCPTKAIVFGTKKEMIAHAETRIADLKSRGFDQAGLYNPRGVGGTHVMYVLHHADQPEIYAGLPANPVTATRLDEAWKGSAYAGMAIVALTAVTGILHQLFSRKSTD